MPLSPPLASPATTLTRRQFLGAAGASAIALSCPAADAPKPEFTFALATDTHLGRATNDDKAMQRLVEEINDSGAAFTLFCGDLVDKGHIEENQKRYPAWVDIAKGLKKDWFAVPGNHDPDEQFAKHIRKDIDHAFDHKGLAFVCFRNAEPNPGHLGVITPEQHQWLGERFEAAAKKGQRVVLAAHVIYHENKAPDVGWYVKKGREEFGKLLQAHKHVGAFVAGHFHCGFRGWDDTFGVHEVILPAASYNRDRGLAKAPGYSLNEFRPGWVKAEVFADRMLLHYKPLRADVSVAKELAFKR